MRLDQENIKRCARHIRLCLEVAPSPTAGEDCLENASVEFLCRRCAQFYGQALPIEAYWAAAEQMDLVADKKSCGHTRRIRVRPYAAWALLAARNEQVDLPLFHGIHPTVNHAIIWDLLPSARRALLDHPPRIQGECSGVF